MCDKEDRKKKKKEKDKDKRFRKQERNKRDFSGSLVVKNLPSSTGGAGSIPGQGAKIPTCLTAKVSPKYKTEAV